MLGPTRGNGRSNCWKLSSRLAITIRWRGRTPFSFLQLFFSSSRRALKPVVFVAQTSSTWLFVFCFVLFFYWASTNKKARRGDKALQSLRNWHPTLHLGTENRLLSYWMRHDVVTALCAWPAPRLRRTAQQTAAKTGSMWMQFNLGACVAAPPEDGAKGSAAQSSDTAAEIQRSEFGLIIV